MKKAFTLVEMLIVVALIATLMSIVLKLTSVGADESKRNATVLRLAKLENCLSGYYAAYGSYPPVRLHTTRDINEPVNGLGVQDSSKTSVNLWNWDIKKFRSGSKQDEEEQAWRQVKAVCEAQPVALEAPDPMADGIKDAFKNLIDAVQANMADKDYTNYPKKAGDCYYETWSGGFGTIYDNLGALDNEIPWSKVRICKFGLMSYLLPRFQAMMGWERDMFNGNDCKFEQWNANNGNVPHDPFTGNELNGWKEVNDYVLKANGSEGGSDSEIRKARAFLEAIPSEAVTARWIPNLEEICSCDYPNLRYYGIKINADDSYGMFNVSSDKSSRPPCVKVYSFDGPDSTRNLYHLQCITVNDGWGTEFFYYSPAPHQTYQLWSAGKNCRTFPVWISRQNLESAAKERVAVWTEDDIRGMSN